MTDEEFERAFGGKDRVDWMREQPSIISGKRPCVSAHVRGGGVSRRADSCWTVPMTYDEHQQMHSEGQDSYAARHGLTQDDLDRHAIETERRWQRDKPSIKSIPW